MPSSTTAKFVIDTLHVIALAVPWCITVVGWRLVSRQADRRETRKDCRALVSDICARITDIEQDAIQYWTSAPGSVEVHVLGAQISRSISATRKAVARLKNLLDITDTTNLLLEFNEACTGGLFQSNGREVLGVNDLRVIGISVHAMELVESLERAYAARYEVR